MTIKRTVMSLIVLMSVFGKVSAQPFNLDKNLKPIELLLFKFQPKDAPKAKGKLGISKAYQVSDTAYYFCKGVSIYSIVSVVASLKEKITPITISLHKNSWNQSLRNKQTDKNGLFQEQFKTEGSFAIRVITKKKPVNYNLYVWVSDEANLNLPPPFKKK